MAIETTPSDTARGIQHDPDQTWPSVVTLQVSWHIGDRVRTRTEIIQGDQFFGRGQFGAPLSGDHLINAIERMRRQGPPPILPQRGPPSGKSKIPRNKRHRSRDVADPKSLTLRSKR